MSDAITRVITRDLAEEWDLHYDAPGEILREQTGSGRWESRHRVIFTAPDDGLIYAARYYQGLTEQQEQDPWNDAKEITLTRYESYERTVTAWRPVTTEDAARDTQAGQQ